VLSSNTTEYWLETLKGKIPCAPVYDIPHAMNNPYIRDIGMVQQVPHPANPDMEILSNPIKLDGQRLSGKASGAMGVDTDALLAEMGYSQSQVNELKANGAI
jgi:crotonobetainyl-CoA:carnitine CoA-transferase CaiB-like acyl-CoA transferase